jgi:hypothetical protein
VTFIASVVARKGAAIIADSLVTSVGRFLDLEKFTGLIAEKETAAAGGSISLDPKELEALFEKRASHTKDFEEKLFKFDDYTAITTAGAAWINGKRIEDLLHFVILPPIQIFGVQGHPDKTIDEKVDLFCSGLDQEIRAHLQTHKWIGSTVFLITNFNKDSNVTRIFEIKVKMAPIEHLADPGYQTYTRQELPTWQTVVCDGQNKLADRLLYGGLNSVNDALEGIVQQVLKDFNIDSAAMPVGYIDTLAAGPAVLTSSAFADMKILGLRNLSLQQAVDLASLLMSIEINFQKYTENIPTVGGVVKLAVIDKAGFRIIKGEEVSVTHLH